MTAVTVQREGADGQAWIDALPGIADELLMRWNCSPSPSPSASTVCGQVGIIIPVRRIDGSEAVLKISFPHPGNVHQPDALAAWRGQGAVLMFERDDARFAMLLERAESRSLADLDDPETAIALAGALARRLAVPAPAHLPRMRDQAAEFEAELIKDAESLADPLPRHIVDTAVDTVRELGRDQPDTMIHGDLHGRNVLSAEREPWLAIDPKGCAGDLAHDAASFLITGAESLLGVDDLSGALVRRVAIFADAAQIDRERTLRWLQARVVSGAHHSRRFDRPKWIVQAYDRIAEALTVGISPGNRR